jgi:hypothetical protein
VDAVWDIDPDTADGINQQPERSQVDRDHAV